MKFRPFNEARQFVQTLGIKNEDGWKEYCKAGKKPEDIPKYPKTIYKNEWKGFGDWLGINYTSPQNRKYPSFEEARKFARSLGFKNQEEWFEYCKSGKKPENIPSNPHTVYKNEWRGYGDWLGTGRKATQDIEFLPFEEARNFVHTLNLKNQHEWRQYLKSGRKPSDIPNYPEGVYKKYWKGMGDWLGTYTKATFDKEFLPFEEAKKYVCSLGFKNVREWEKWIKSGKKPKDIPSSPNLAYKEKWKGWKDWLGTEFVPFEEARRIIHSFGFKSEKDWRKYRRSENRRMDIPSSPDKVYKEWKDWPDFLGTNTIASQKRVYRSFEEARKFARSLGFKSQDEWYRYCKSGEKPKEIPSSPYVVYEKEWKGAADWLGTEFLPYVEAREYVRSLGIKNSIEWRRYCKSGEKPDYIPASPGRTYKNEWTSWLDWFGTEPWSFEKAREYVHRLKLKNIEEWYEWCKSGEKPDVIHTNPRAYKNEWTSWGDWLGTGTVASYNKEFWTYQKVKEYIRGKFKGKEEYTKWARSKEKPKEIPSSPGRTYKNEWTSWGDFLGYEETAWSLRRVKESLRSLIESRIIYQWDEAVLYSFLLRKGLLNLQSRHTQLFKNLIEASRTQEGLKAIENYANSDSEIPPDLSKFKEIGGGLREEEIVSASPQELSSLVENTDPLDYGEIKTAEQILAQTNVLESINVDEEAMQFYVDYSIDELWKCAFRDKENTILAVKCEGKSGNKYHDIVAESFLSDYEGTQNIKIPNGYAFPKSPTLMQLYVAYKVKTSPYFGNFSGTGAGKTLSAVLASRVIDSKMTLIVCPNDVVSQWARNILEIFPDSKVITGKEAFYQKYNDNKHQYLVLNYDKFSQEESPNLILNLIKQKVDFVVLDEIHFVKKRDEESSQRRRNLDGLVTAVRKKNSNVKVLGLSATPVVNNLMEGRSLLELITGKMYEDVATKPTIPNAVTLYEKLSLVSIRELPKYDIDVQTEHIDVKTQIIDNNIISIKELKSNPLTIERFLSDAKIPEIIRHIQDQTIIYTEYVTDIIEKLSKAVEGTGYSYALYTGSDHSGLKRFLDKKVQVLIASRPISTGVDGLQHICNRLIINTLPWTNAQYQQLLGRLVRKGQIRDVVHVYIIKANLSGYPYDQLKWNRIQFKRTLADCAVDGRLPEKNLVTPQQAAMEAVKWLERLERGEVSSIVRRDLEVELTPVQIEQRIRKYGDFTRLNNLINNEKSETTHERMLRDPMEWEEYHRQYREARKTWSVIPYEEIIKRTKQLSPRLQIGDFGCGEAKLLEALGETRVYSFDHVAVNDKVTVCDMKKVPLSDEALDVAIFSLSLMGKNYPEYITEAKRCLVTNGTLIIAETTKSLKEGRRLCNLRQVLTAQGFDIYSDEEKGDFTFIEAREL